MDFFGVIFTVIFSALALMVGMYLLFTYPWWAFWIFLGGVVLTILLWPKDDEKINKPNEWE